MTDRIKRLYSRLYTLFGCLLKSYTSRLEIHLADHCILNCYSCAHYSPIAPKAFCDLNTLKESLKRLSKMQESFYEIHLLGGEPLLNPDIVDAIRIVRKFFDKTDIILVTNGILLPQMSDLFWKICRSCDIMIGITIYPIEIEYDKLISLCEEKFVKYKIFGDRNDKNWYCFKLNYHEKNSNSNLNYEKCWLKVCWQLKGDRIYSCPTSAYIDFINNKFGTHFKIRKNDYLQVNKLFTKYQLRLFKFKAKPFCSYCVFPLQSMDWKPSGRDIEEWVSSDRETDGDRQ